MHLERIKQEMARYASMRDPSQRYVRKVVLCHVSLCNVRIGYVRLGPMKDCNQNEQEIAPYASMCNMVFNLYFSLGREIHEIMLTQYLIYIKVAESQK